MIEHRVVNCCVHHGNYAGLWSGTPAAAGRRHLISPRAFRHSGRDPLSLHGLTERKIQYNDLAEAKERHEPGAGFAVASGTAVGGLQAHQCARAAGRCLNTARQSAINPNNTPDAVKRSSARPP